MGAFDTSNVSQQGGSAVTAKAGVQDRSTLVAMEGAGNLLSFGLEAGANKMAADSQAAGNAATNAFAAQQLDISDAVAQGGMSAAEGRRRMRVNSQKALSAGMSFGDMSKTQKAIVTTSGFGKVVSEGTPEEQQRMKLTNEALGAGFVPRSASQAEQEAGVDNYLRHKKATADIALLASQQSLRGAKFDHRVKTRVDEAKVAVGALAQSQMEKLNTVGADILAQMAGGLDQASGIQLVNAAFAETEQLLQEVGGETGNVVVAVSQPILAYKQLLMDNITGKVSDEVRDRETKKFLAIQSHQIVSSPEVARAVATAGYFRGVISVAPEMNALAIEALVLNGSPTGKTKDLLPDDEEEEITTRDYFSNIKENMTKVEFSVDPKAFKADMRTQADNILKGVVDHRGSIQGAKSLNQVVEFLASPQYGTFTQANGGIDSGTAIEAKAVFDAQYEDVVLPLLKREYEAVDFGGTGSDGITSGNLVVPLYTGSGVTFQAREGVRLSARSVDKLRALNAKTGPMLNRLVRMSAHLAGHRNYKKVFDEGYAGIFGEVKKDDNAE